MNAPVRGIKPSSTNASRAPSPLPEFLLECFAELCWSRAYRWATWQILDLHDAVDFLQQWAEEQGLVAVYGQNLVQQLMSDEFGRQA
jgi:hypothetical protein